MIHSVVSSGLRCDVAVGPEDPGGRITSLRSFNGHEWLAPSDSPQGRRNEAFVRPGMGGWDEVAPSVQSDRLPGGVLVPDHGDLWNTQWSVVEATESALVMEVELSSIPATLRRSITATAAGLRLDYLATTESVAAVPFLWCAHPQFAAAAGTTFGLELAGTVVSPTLVEVYPAPGKARNLPSLPPEEFLLPGTSLKAFLGLGETADEAVLKHVGGRMLRLSWETAEVPYLGLFWDNGEFASEPVIAIEPSTGWGDTLSAATASGQVRTVQAGAPLRWSITLSQS